ncbi:ArsR/SmtB family transcription factor [Yoonia maritima]|uniref:ArsR/SmtB family transcription factor n=1 Tax=Yoonia maritima TaxID=1435347 RepID=UPI003734E549
MDNVTAAQGFSALGSESRIEVFQTLVKAGKNGLLVGDIQQRTGIPASTLAHHLKFLSTAQLILQEKKGRTIVNRANFDHLESLAAFILEECCSEPGPQS